jgi:surface protein
MMNLPILLTTTVLLVMATTAAARCEDTPDYIFTSNSKLRDAIVKFFKAKTQSSTSVAARNIPPISEWCVDGVKDFSNVFRYTDIAEEDLSLWNTSSAVTMAGMFSEAPLFLGNGLQTWDTSNVLSMSHMFANAQSFGGSIATWNVGSVTDFSFMFLNAVKFNGIYDTTWDIDQGTWNVGQGTNFQGMFQGASSFQDQSLAKWTMLNAIDLSYMFQNASQFNVDLRNWGVGNVVTMNSMFDDATSLNVDLSSWDVTQVSDLSAMFRRTNLNNVDYCAWGKRKEISNFTKTGRMFFGIKNCANTSDVQFCAKPNDALAAELQWKPGNRSIAIGPFCQDCYPKDIALPCDEMSHGTSSSATGSIPLLLMMASTLVTYFGWV